MRENTGELERLRALAEVNYLLLELHARAASLPASLNLKAAIDNTISRLRDLLQPDVVVLFLADPTAARSHWEVVVADGLELPASVRQGELPDAMKEASKSLGPLLRAELSDGDGVTLGAISGLYAPLWARDTLVGLLAVERVDNQEPFTEADADIVAGVARHAGLAIDNARWFRRLRTLGAEEERGRIAREMHDRLGQSLAYVAISLDRMATESRNGTSSLAWPETAGELEDLANEVRKATRDVRSKLTDLRVDLTEDVDLAEALAGLLERVEQRSGIVTSLRTDGEGALSPVTEREVVRIAQEAINNAERHSGAHHIDVRWRCDTVGAELEVLDDGKGLAASAPLRRDAFGILGMRERADAIGARFGITSPPGQGTMVRLQIGQPVTNGRRRN
jgi:signal transduction histidine kinase